MYNKLDGLEIEVRNCWSCNLYKTRNKPLLGDGNPESRIMLVGESPGYQEDLTGKAFVGEAGKVLDRLLNEACLGRRDVYITNVLKCHPPRNHNPNRKQIEACIPFLFRQIEIIQPEVIITLGKFASRELLPWLGIEYSRVCEIHGSVFLGKLGERNIKVIPMYHPAFACFHENMINVLVSDFKRVRDVVKYFN